MEKTIEIPEGYEARIEGNKVIIEPKESKDERIRKGLLRHFKNKTKPYWNEIAVKDIIAYLERQKEQKPAEWSEKDKIHLNNAILVAKKEWGVNSYTARWLETLRDNYKKCNSRWKPSEEQMDAIQYVSNFDYGGHRKALESLYSDLKKL